MVKRIRDTAGTRSETVAEVEQRHDGALDEEPPSPQEQALIDAEATAAWLAAQETEETEKTEEYEGPNRYLESDADAEWQEAERLASALAEPASAEDPGNFQEPAPEPETRSETPAVATLPDTREVARERLRALGAQREELSRGLELCEGRLWTAIREAHGVKVPKLTIAKDAGISRQTVYNVLSRPQEGE